MKASRLVAALFVVILFIVFSKCQPPLLVHGGGATFPELVYYAWSDAFTSERPDLKVLYNSTGSGEGKKNIINRSQVFSGSDIPLSTSDYQQVADLQMLPFIAGGIVPFVKSFDKPLTFSRELLADIFMNNVKYWDDPRILELNSDITLPHVAIRVVYRKDSSGTTTAFTNSLSKFSEEWATRFGTVSIWPAELRNKTDIYYPAQGNDGVLTLSSIIPYAISYLSYNFAFLSLSESYCSKVINKAGNKITINTASVTAATEGAKFNSNFAADITDAPGENAWPIATFTYLVVRRNSTDPSQCTEFQGAIDYFEYALEYYIPSILVGINGMSPSSSSIRDRIRDTMAEITCNGVPMFSPNATVSPAPAPPDYYYNNLPGYTTIDEVTYTDYFNDIGSVINAKSAKDYKPSTISSLLSSDIVYKNYYGATQNSSASSLSLHSSILLLFTLISLTLIFTSSSSSSNNNNTTDVNNGNQARKNKIRVRLPHMILIIGVLGLIFGVHSCSAEVTELRIAGFFPLTGYLAEYGSSSESAVRLAVEDLNQDLLNPLNYSLLFRTYDTRSSAGGSTQSLSTARTTFNMFGIVGCHDSIASSTVALSATLFYFPQISYGSRANFLSDTEEYPYFARVIPAYATEGIALASLIKLYNWNKIGLIFTSDDYGTLSGDAFIQQFNTTATSITIVQFSPSQETLDAQMLVLRDANVRVIVMLAGSVEDSKTVLLEADRYHMIRDDFVWFGGSFASSSDLFYNSTSQETNQLVKYLSKGLVSLKLKGGFGPKFEAFLDRWEILNPKLYSSSGKRSIPLYAPYAYDAMELFIRTFLVDPFAILPEFMDHLGDISFTGLTGPIKLDPITADRLAIYDIVNLPDQYSNEGDRGFVVIGDWFEENVTSSTNGFTFTYDITFHSGSTSPPAPEVRPAVEYWVCSEGKKKTDETGLIRLDAPGPDAENIAHHYYCDTFMDCHNFSDESGTCASNYLAVFIVFGVITGILIIITFLLIPFTIIFGLCVSVIRIRSASPPFLIVLLLSIIVGYGSVFTWYGQPNAVACGFQAWLLGLSVVSMVAVLVAKNYRIWKIFHNPLKRKTVTDVEIYVLYGIIMVPAIVILFLWTLISTPTALLTEVGGDPHWVCDTGGFTGPPGGIVFFFILVAYIGFVLLIGAIVSIAIRKVPSLFNESRLIAISIYNILILSCIIIPIFFVLLKFNPFVGWIIRTMAIIYAFTATLALTFLPKVFGVMKDFARGKAILSSSDVNFSTSGSSSSQRGSSGISL